MNSLLDATDMVKVLQRAAVEAVRASKPTEVTHGKVVSTEPMQIVVDQKITLGELQLDRGETMEEYMAETELEIEEIDLALTMEIDGKTVTAKVKGSGKMIGKMKARRSLDVGDEVILVRKQGGQNYIMYDKVRKNVT